MEIVIRNHTYKYILIPKFQKHLSNKLSTLPTTTMLSEPSTTIPPNAPHPHSHLSSKPLYRCSTLFRSRPDISESQFFHHWYTLHAPLVAPWAQHYKFSSYIQYHTPFELRAALTNGKQGYFNGASPFQACADIYVEEYEDYLAAFRDPYYLEVIQADEALFVDKGQVDTNGGDERPFETIKAVSSMGLCR